MRKTIGIIIVALVLSSFMPDEKGNTAPRNLKALFACKQGGKIQITAEQFLEFMHTPLCARDSMDSTYQVIRFDLMYAETGLYQDSAGLPIIHTERTYRTFRGDTLDTVWKELFKEHAYKGDTIRFSNIHVKGNDNRNYRAANIELVLR